MNLVYVTFPDEDAREKIAKQVVSDGLAKCVTSFPVTSLYRWEGDQIEEDEVVALFKTSAEHGDALMERIEELHPYDVPCIIRLDAVANDSYEHWLQS